MDDFIAFIGFCLIITGVFLWLGLPATFIISGITLVYIAVKIEPGGARRKDNEPDKAANTNK